MESTSIQSERLTLFLVWIVGVIRYQLSVAGCLMVFLCHKDDAIFTLKENKAKHKNARKWVTGFMTFIYNLSLLQQVKAC